MSKPGNFWRKIHGKVTKKPTNFSWLIESKLAGCGMPTTINEVNWVLNQGIKSIVTMTENALPESWIKDILQKKQLKKYEKKDLVLFNPNVKNSLWNYMRSTYISTTLE